MLSDETATSSRFQQTLNWLKNFNKLNLQINKNKKQKKVLTQNKDLLFENLRKIDEQNSKVLMFTRKGYIIEKILSLHPTIEVVIFTDNQKVHDLTYLRKNATIIKTKKFPKNLDNFIYSKIKKNKKKIFKNKKNIFLLYAAFARKNSRANTFTILEERDFNK
jgi:pyruvate kinase